MQKILKLLYKFINYLYSRLFNVTLMHVIGDSHARVFENTFLFVVHHIGPATMHNLNKKNNTTKSNEKLFNILRRLDKKLDTVMLVFGEIDCRIHIYNSFEKQQRKVSIDDLIDKTVYNFGVTLDEIKRLGINFCVCGIPPTGFQKNIYNYPYYPSPEVQCDIYNKFNSQLNKFCKKNNYKYIDVYTMCVDEHGFIRKEYCADDIHINKAILKFLKSELRSRSLIN